MTTTVKVSAHCDDDTFVSISEEDADTMANTILHDGEEHEVYAYGDRVITVKEVRRWDLKDNPAVIIE